MEARKVQGREILSTEFLFGKAEISNFRVFKGNGLIFMDTIRDSSMKSMENHLIICLKTEGAKTPRL
jgi:hypothetical protein